MFPRYYIISLVGEGGVGKTSWLNVLRGKGLERVPSVFPMRLDTIDFETQERPIKFTIIESCKPDDRLDGNDAAIIMCDDKTIDTIPKWLTATKNCALQIICYNKYEEPSDLEPLNRYGKIVVPMSVHKRIGIMDPLHHIVRILETNNSLILQ